jgi:hypothetical protein
MKKNKYNTHTRALAHTHTNTHINTTTTVYLATESRSFNIGAHMLGPLSFPPHQIQIWHMLTQLKNMNICGGTHICGVAKHKSPLNLVTSTQPPIQFR